MIWQLAKPFNNGGYLSALQRTFIGEYALADAWNLEELIAKVKEMKVDSQS